MARRSSRPTTVVERTVHASPEQIFAVLADAWLFPCWVVGATHMRDADANWPAAGARLHHRVGAWPFTLDDSTTVVESDAPRRLVLQAAARPFGHARIELTLVPDGSGTLVRMAEAPTRGPARMLDNPLQRRVLVARNRECLERLAAIAERSGQR